MLKVILATLIVTVVLPAQTSDLDAEFFRFMNVASQLERKLLGCPPESWTIDQCSPLRGENDWKLRKEVWQRGKQLFGHGW